MPKLSIPEKVCSHCGGNEWYTAVIKNKSSTKIIYKCVKRVLDINKRSNCTESRKRALDKYRETEKFKLVQHTYYESNKEKIIEKTKNWISNNVEQYNRLIYKQKKLYIDHLSDCYLKNLLTKRQSDLKFSDITTDLIELKRKQLTLTRKIKQHAKS
jgi:hypothetical protein